MSICLTNDRLSLSQLKSKFPDLQATLKMIMTKEMQVVVDEEKCVFYSIHYSYSYSSIHNSNSISPSPRFLKEEPDRLENALRRCKKLTGTLVTLKR